VTDWIEKLARQRYADAPPGSPTAEEGGPIIIRAHYGLPVDLFKPQDPHDVPEFVGPAAGPVCDPGIRRTCRAAAPGTGSNIC